MKKLVMTLFSISALSLVALLSSVAQAELENPGGTGGLESLRGNTPLEDTRPADVMKKYPREQVLESDYVYQPPLIPHNIRSYEVSLNANKCLACHSWKNAKEMGATKISVTHYMNREDAVLADVSPRRYFCLQCHVPQASAKPLVENEFERVDSLRK
ncbi:periplasmic nitrate reductase electron transfer subunit [Vibrio navarrensis]|uniref:Periplasmic nitrate reductase, electron transfer subunit n=1 Tax=Vibrio navarrensis TaxID=29495 RepID=A0A099MEE6_9VIBR|nr:MULTISPECIES: nitrate reductase cytochrome c-type subunit [Vibrio]EGR2797372.1 nitrate reductase cytochrome c-type subunit [Vibrio navarrensis]EHA1124665.1 nitrate reductase cytochrome c-type subunit [Vibrio navarrensis]EJK2113418.1 nitrate reductase cytochrome c-type subunit [Vibrio navarrensis]EJL6396400.1 nitrate reductase cytochrome c-type subunit [Vibrio navarrensis]EJL6400541.1 nitrate reductase cytochrome c-type subunit [Vibrio navarrensis]